MNLHEHPPVLATPRIQWPDGTSPTPADDERVEILEARLTGVALTEDGLVADWVVTAYRIGKKTDDRP